MRISSRSSLFLLSCAVGLTLAGCQASDGSKSEAEKSVESETPTATSATAELTGPDGAKFGTATLTAIDGGLKLDVKADNLAKGEHGIHLHTTGKCDGPKFESAGGHWNPGSKQHGLDNPQGSHSGDMPNINATGEASTTYSYDLKGASLADGAMAVLDADGTAIVIHAKADDNKTDPSGNSGDRIVCGVFAGS